MYGLDLVALGTQMNVINDKVTQAQPVELMFNVADSLHNTRVPIQPMVVKGM